MLLTPELSRFRRWPGQTRVTAEDLRAGGGRCELLTDLRDNPDGVRREGHDQLAPAHLQLGVVALRLGQQQGDDAADTSVGLPHLAGINLPAHLGGVGLIEWQSASDALFARTRGKI
jgi:hypothetical protein